MGALTGNSCNEIWFNPTLYKVPGTANEQIEIYSNEKRTPKGARFDLDKNLDPDSHSWEIPKDSNSDKKSSAGSGSDWLLYNFLHGNLHPLDRCSYRTTHCPSSQVGAINTIRLWRRLRPLSSSKLNMGACIVNSRSWMLQITKSRR